MLDQQSLQKNKSEFTDETIQSLRDLGEVLRNIHNRLISEGYVLFNGKFIKPNENKSNKNY